VGRCDQLETEFLFKSVGRTRLPGARSSARTGDAQLTITQRVALAGGIIVTTPQEVALMDVAARRHDVQEVEVPA